MINFNHNLKLIFVGICLAVNCNLSAQETVSPRERQLMDFGWKFYLGNPWGDVIGLAKAADNKSPAKVEFSDSDWRTINIPHDWVIELPFDRAADCNHGFKPVGPGFPQNNVAWYRRVFDLPEADSGKKIWIEFEGVYHRCDVFVNGWFVGHHDDGYDGFQYDITDIARFGGTNVIAVMVDASKFEGWFYEGAGIYRHVWLEKTAPLALAPDGVFVYSHFDNNVPNGKAGINLEARLLNPMPNSVDATVFWEILSPDGRLLAKCEVSEKIEGPGEKILKAATKIVSPILWSPESPNLYKLITTVKRKGEILDRKDTEFGIRTLAFDANEGFLLNGRHYEIKGVCNHQDHAGVGVALPDALQYFRVAKLKEMGCNAYRTSHNAPAPELLEACDRLGMLVLDENRLFGSDAENIERLKGQIVRDRNHPSVFAWSLGNEEWNAQGTPEGGAVMRRMQILAHSLDPSRLCTCAVNGSYGDIGIFASSDVGGLNYHFEEMDKYHAAHPKALILGTEQASTIGTRGIYTNDASRGYVSAYDDHNPRWGDSAEEWWAFFDARPWLSGGFVWTGFDYRGEPTPYQWPCISSHFGILDTCGFPKDNFWYYQSWWTDKPVLHLLPHWNWPGHEGQEIDVRALSNCQEVELFLNGQSLGRQSMKKDSELKWKVKYMPGVLSAKGFKDGRLNAETELETTGQPAAIQLVPQRVTIDADGQDVAIFTVAVLDAQGRVAPTATNTVQFELAGPGKILGVGNGDPTCHEPDTLVEQPSIHIVPENANWHYKTFPSVKRLTVELQPGFDDSAWEKTDPQSDSGALNEHEQAVFRVKIKLNEGNLAARAIRLKIGRIDDRGWIYLNGKRIGESRDWQASPSFDIKRFLKAGENSLAIAVINDGGHGGVAKGVSLEFVNKAPPQKWQRSVFNGVAQVIVQSTQEPGEIKLMVSANNLVPTTMSIHSKLPMQSHNVVAKISLGN